MIERNDIKLVVIFVLLGFILGPKLAPSFSDANAEVPRESVASVAAAPLVAPRIDPFASVSVVAKSAIVYDISSKRVLYSKEAELPRPLASLTKIMTAYVARENMDATGKVSVESEDMSYEGNQDLRPGEKWTLQDLLSLTLISSSNKGAGAVAASVGGSLDPSLVSRNDKRERFVDLMNARAKTLGLASMHFNDPTGLDFGNELGGEGSAHDTAILFARVLEKYPDFLEITSKPMLTVTSDSGIKHRVKNTNELASGTIGFIGGKTGYTEAAGGNLAMVVDAGVNRPVAIVVLGSTREGRFNDMQTLINALRSVPAQP